MRDAIVFDFDGVIANIDHRLHHVRAPKGHCFKPDWDAFFSPKEIRNDELFLGTWAIMMGMFTLNAVDVLILSARPEKTRRASELWLRTQRVPFDILSLRPDGDWKLHSAAQWKKHEMSHVMDEYNILGFYDDSLSNVKAVAELGVPSFLFAPNGERR
jgi:hypothetical protein